MRYLTVIRNLLLVVAGLALLAGCSISYSSGKSSDSSVSSFSSGGGEKKADKATSTYIDDVVAATNQFVSHGGSDEVFQRRIAFLAGQHGITAWANNDSTFIAMGKGLKQAGVEESRIATLPFFSTITDSHKRDLIMEGYKK